MEKKKRKRTRLKKYHDWSRTLLNKKYFILRFSQAKLFLSPSLVVEFDKFSRKVMDNVESYALFDGFESLES